jgi:hypothetical protein
MPRRQKFRGRHNLPIITLLSCFSLQAVSQTGDPIGVVLVTKGRVEAVSANGTTRLLSRSSEIFENDTIIVGADGLAQVRMIDDARISFKPNTEFTFQDYSFDNNPATEDSAIMSMVRGGFRTLSGTIGEDDQDVYSIDTPMANIGIRGTTHEAVIIGQTLFTGVSDGGTTISNNEGSLDTGLGAQFDYSQTNQGDEPQGLLEQPLALRNFDLTPGLDEDQEDSDEASDEAAAGEEPGPAQEQNDAGASGQEQETPDALVAVTGSESATGVAAPRPSRQLFLR